MTLTDIELTGRLEKTLHSIAQRGGDFTDHLNLNLVKVEAQTMSAEFRYEVLPWSQNRIGMMHGGMTASLFDVAMGILSMAYAKDPFTPTIQMSVSYLKPVPIGATLHIRARILSKGRTIIHCFAEAWLKDHPETLVATANGSYHQPSARQKTETL